MQPFENIEASGTIDHVLRTTRQIHDVGQLLLFRKYRFLRLSHLNFVIGAVVAGLGCAAVATAGFS